MNRDDVPFIGLRPFSTGDARSFVGRRREVRDVAGLVIAHRVLVVHGPSGVGKTSLMLAGVIPRLLADEWDVLPVMRVVGFSDVLGGHPQRRDFAGAPVQQIAILDQAEELLTIGDAADIVPKLCTALERNPGLHLVLVIRDDYLVGLDEYAPAFSRRLDMRYHVGPLRRDAAIAMLMADGEGFPREVAELVASELSMHDAIEPVQLQIVARSIWNSTVGQGRDATAAAVHRVTVDSALRAYYDNVLATVAAQHRLSEAALDRWIAHHLLTANGTRTLLQAGPGETAGMQNAVLDILVDRYLLRREIHHAAAWYELAHDRLAQAIHDRR